MQFVNRKIDGLYEVRYEPFSDHRGFLAKPFNKQPFEDAGFSFDLAQVIHSYTKLKNTVRGMYVQAAPRTEGKVIAPIRGRMYWVAVDVRKGSPTFGQWDGMLLCPETPSAYLVTPGFAHGCLSLTDNVDLLLMADNHHSPDHGTGFVWDDPEVGIDWPLLSPNPIISSGHADYPPFADFKTTHNGI